jgi:hypothetical protein
MEELTHILTDTLPQAIDLKFIAACVLALGVAYLFNLVAEKVLRRLLRAVSQRTDTAQTETRYQQLRRAETFVGIGMAVTRTVVIVAALILAWRLTNPSTAPFALIGASTLFVVLAGATVAPLLRDITYGLVMTAERWYNVGDHIVVDPFVGVSGLVEQITLRSTRLRSLTGEVIWIHNQHIQGVRVTPGAVRTIALDVFVNDLAEGKKLVAAALNTLPTGPTMVTRKMTIAETEKVGDTLWRITAVGQTAIGREWLIEDFGVAAIKKEDSLDQRTAIIHGPIVRFMDEMAEKRFRRSVRSHR